MTLRPGLRFHDGTPVLARDVVASLRRWGARDTFGGTLFAVVDELAAPDDRTVTWRLKRPFPLLPDCLGKVGSVTAAIMPERLAKSDPAIPVKEMIGSGPFRFVQPNTSPGSRVVYARFDGYASRPEPSSLLAGGKPVHFDRVEWQTIPDPSTAAAALQRGEVDWVEQPLTDLLPALRRDRNLKVEVIDPTGAVARDPLQPAAIRRSTTRRSAASCWARSRRPSSCRPSSATTARCGRTAAASSRPAPRWPTTRAWRR